MNQDEWIKEIFKHRPQGFDPYVEQHFETDQGLQYGQWNKYQGQKRIDERSVFPNEIVIDIDAETTEKCREETRKVTTYLEKNSFDFYVADTGGTGFHIHLFFKYENLEADEYRPYRLALYDYLKAECREKVSAEVELWDDQPVHFDITDGKGHLVRALGGRKTETKLRKTQVLASSLEKKEVEDYEDVEYPSRIPWGIEISKTGTDKSHLSIQKINDKVEEVQEEEEKQHKAEIDNSFDEKIEGLEDVRDVPASKVLDLIDEEYKKKQNFQCPFHNDNNPSANIYEKNGVERLYCFSDSCVEDSESTPKVRNAVDILIEHGYTFSEALKTLSKEFNIDVQIGYNPADYFGNNIKGNYVVQPQKLADEIMDEYQFKNVLGKGFYVWKDGYWQKLSEDNDIIGSEVDKRLKNETASKHRNNVREIIKNRDNVKVEREDFQTPDNMIPFSNGTYDLDKDELVDPKPDHNFDFKYNAKYDPSVEDDSIQEFLKTLMPNSEVKVKKLREVVALSMLPAKINQKVPILYGQGSNGKNQFVKMIWKILGQKSYHKTSAADLQQDTFEMASVYDKQMAFFDEFEDVTRPGQLKTLVGDEQQKVREMRKESYTAKTSVYPVFAANELPTPRDNSDGFFRRWEIIDFEQKFTSDPEDGRPMKLPPKKLEQEYMNDDAINAFATSLIDDIQELRKRNNLTEEQTTEEVRRTWMKKGNALYQFIDKYLVDGDLPDEDNGSTEDWIEKDELLTIVNNYMDANNNSPVKKHQLTKALDEAADLRVWTNYRPRVDDDKRPSAYAGLKFNEDMVQEVKGFFTFNAYVSPVLSTVDESVLFRDLSDHPKISGCLRYLDSCEDREADMIELVRELNLDLEDLEHLNDCEYISISSRQLGNMMTPVYSIDEEAVNASDTAIHYVDGEIHQSRQPVRELIEGMSSDTVKKKQDVVEEVTSNSELTESEVIDRLEKLKENGRIFYPTPDEVQKL